MIDQLESVQIFFYKTFTYLVATTYLQSLHERPDKLQLQSLE